MRSQLAIRLCCLGVIGVFSSAAVAQRAVERARDSKPRNDASGLEVHVSEVTGAAMFVTARDGGAIRAARTQASAQAQPMDFLVQYGHLFGITDPASELVVTKTRTDRIGHTRTTYEQRYHGIPVFGAVVHVHQNRNGSIHAANGSFFAIPDHVSTETRLDRTAAEAVVRAAVKAGRSAPVWTDELVIVDPVWYGGPARGAQLAYRIVANGQRGSPAETFFVDARSGSILDRWEINRCDLFSNPADPVGARSRSRSDVSPEADGPVASGLNACGTSTLCRVVIDLRVGPDPLRSEGEPPISPPEHPVNVSYDYAGDVYNYFWNAHNRNSVDDVGGTMYIFIDGGSECVQTPGAFWNSCPGSPHNVCLGRSPFVLRLCLMTSSGMSSHTESLPTPV